MPAPPPIKLCLKHSLALVIACSLALVALPVSATPIASSPEHAANGTPFVTLDKNAAAVPVDGAFVFSTDIVVDRPTSYLEARIQIHNPGGSLLFQKTEIRNDITTGTVSVEFSRELEDLTLPPAAYPVQLRVRSDSDGEIREWTIDDELLLYDPDAPPVALALAVHVSATPSYDPEGRFVIDPNQTDQAREQVDALAAYILDTRDARMTLALPPMLAEEWARIASGYETSGPEGINDVEPDSAVPVSYAETLTRLGAAIDSGRLELATVPYADPDLAGLAESNRLGDLIDHFTRGVSATLASLEASSSTGLVTADGILPAGAIPAMRARDLEYALVSQAFASSAEATPSSGVYEIVAGDTDRTITALVTDSTLAEDLRSARIAPLIHKVFERSISDAPNAPVVAMIEVGPGHEMTIEELDECLDELAEASWVTFVTGKEAAESPSSGALTLAADGSFDSDAPAEYWAEVAAARSISSALMESVGVNDPEAQYASDASLVAQSASWAGPDGAWSSADRGLSFAAASTRVAGTILDGVKLTAQDIALSSAQGEVPVTISNDSEKNLLLRLTSTARGIALPEGTTINLTARPQDNFVTVPVDLQSSLSGDLTIEVWAGDVLLDSADVTIRATYLDRLVLVGGIAIALVGLLLFIRHRARTSASIGTMTGQER